MKCGKCGQELPGIGELQKHKKECRAPVIETAEAQLTGSKGFIIPLDQCPPETKLYAQGQTIGLMIQGRLGPDGIKVEEVNLKR